MHIRIEVDEATLKLLVANHLASLLGDLSPEPDHIRIEVKSKQNYKSQWELADYRAVYETLKA